MLRSPRCARASIVSLALALAACGSGGSGTIGAACTTGDDCASKQCVTEFADGYCTGDCASAPCPTGQKCRPVGDKQLCFAGCGSGADCRSGYMCFQGACVSACTSDGDCGKGMGCTAGSCMPFTGAAVGARCAADTDCAARTCDLNTHTCQTPCTSDDGCAAGETCYVNPVDRGRHGASDGIEPICVMQRAGGKAPGAACKSDDDCVRGACELGLCTSLCDTSGQCTASMECVKSVAATVTGMSLVTACVPRSGTLTIDLGVNGGGPIGLPANTQGMNVFVNAPGYNLLYYAGVSDMTDPAGAPLYMPPTTLDEYYALPLRYGPSEGSSMLLLPNSPSLKIQAGLYDFGTFAATRGGQGTQYRATVRIKLGDAPYTSGHIPLHVLMTDLTAGCGQFSGNPERASFEQTFKAIFAAANLTIGPFVYQNVPGASSVTVSETGGQPPTEIDNLLKTATTGDQPDVLEMVLIDAIHSNSMNGEILGQAGGIPSSTGVPGTPHSGAAISLSSLCYANGGAAGGRALAITAAHELGHSMGLFHSTEMDNHHSPLGDDVAQGTKNLMYWTDDGSDAQVQLSPNQKFVLLANPAVVSP